MVVAHILSPANCLTKGHFFTIHFCELKLKLEDVRNTDERMREDTLQSVTMCRIFNLRLTHVEIDVPSVDYVSHALAVLPGRSL